MAPAPLASAPERRRAFEFARLRLARLRVAGGAALGRALSEACEVAARTLQVERVGVWLFVDERRAIRCYDVFERRSGQHSEGAMLRAADFPTYFRGLEERRTIAAGDARITLRTRVARQATIARTRHRLALDLHIIDNGPGIPDDLKDRVFFPLVSGRDTGTGLGLTLAQAYVQQHGGSIECDSAPGRTVFRILYPLDATKAAA